MNDRDARQVGPRAEFLAFGRPSFSNDEIEAVTRVLRSGRIGMGAETLAFEQELADYLHARHVVTVSSCTAALHLSLVALGIGPGDEVICPSLTWCSTANAALYAGATPVLCDVDEDSLAVSVESVSRYVTNRTRAVMVVHFGGLAVDVKSLRRALPNRVAIVEDAAHAIGARYPDGTPVGSSGNLTCFSFYANKNLSTGEGGAVAVEDPEIAAQLRSLRQHGLSSDAWKRYIEPTKAIVPGVARLGFKANYTDLQASIGRVQLRRQPDFHSLRLELSRRYRARITSTGLPLEFQRGAFDDWHARHLFIVKFPPHLGGQSRDDLLLKLRGFNVGASIHYLPLHRMPLYAGFSQVQLPITERVAGRLMTLPIGASMDLSDVDYVVDTLIAFWPTEHEA